MSFVIYLGLNGRDVSEREHSKTRFGDKYVSFILGRIRLRYLQDTKWKSKKST